MVGNIEVTYLPKTCFTNTLHMLLILQYILVEQCACCLLNHFSHVQLYATLWTVASQAPLPMTFSRQDMKNTVLDITKIRYIPCLQDIVSKPSNVPPLLCLYPPFLVVLDLLLSIGLLLTSRNAVLFTFVPLHSARCRAHNGYSLNKCLLK